MGKNEKELLDKAKKITKCDYDFTKHSFWNIIEDLIFEIEKRDDIISDKNNKIAELESGEDFGDSRYEYGY